MGHIAVSELAYAHPGGESLFFDVSFTISPGEKVGLIGDNGVGKTTLLRLLGGEIPPDEGRVGVGGTMLGGGAGFAARPPPGGGGPPPSRRRSGRFDRRVGRSGWIRARVTLG